MALSEAEILGLLRHFRKITGIQPIPLSDAERQSGMFGPYTPPPPPPPAPPEMTLEEVIEKLKKLKPDTPPNGEQERVDPPPAPVNVVTTGRAPLHPGRKLNIKC